MTFAEFFERIRLDYVVLRVLFEKADRTCWLLCHKAIGKKLVLRRLPEKSYVYAFLRGITHPNLPVVYDILTLADGFAVLEEYIDGVSAAEVLETGPYTYNGAKNLLLGVCAGLDVLHQNGFVHRDIKPENVMIEKGGCVKVIDFDISRAVSGFGCDTRVLGTLGYAPPEQQGVSETDPRSDIYALGVLLNVLLTREHPSVSLVPGRAGRIVLKCTAVSPEKRFQTVRELMEIL